MKQLVNWIWVTTLRGAWVPTIVFTIHVIAKDHFEAYNRWPRIDIPMHLAGGAAIAFFWHVASVQASERGLLGPWHRLTHGLLVFGWTAVAAVVWEFYEFFVTWWFALGVEDGSWEDTLKDLLMGLIGGGIVAILASVFSAGPAKANQNGEPDAVEPDGSSAQQPASVTEGK